MKNILREFSPEFISAGKYKVSVGELLKLSDVLLLDVRTCEEEECMTIAEDLALHYPQIEYSHIPMNTLPDRKDELPHDRCIAVLCRTTSRSPIVYAYLCIKGFSSVRIVEGGYKSLVKTLVDAHGI